MISGRILSRSNSLHFKSEMATIRKRYEEERVLFLTLPTLSR